MPFFQPPTYEGISKAESQTDRPMRNLMRYYGGVTTGFTVYRDQALVWHKVISPTTDILAAAKVYYLGGHIYEITDQEAADLIAGGFDVTFDMQGWGEFLTWAGEGMKWT